MKKNKILHISELGSFIPPIIELIAKKNNSHDHTFFLMGNEKKHPIMRSSNIILVKNNAPILRKIIAILILIKNLYATDKVMLHGLFNQKIIILLFTQPWLLKKCYWIIWGGDLYSYQLAKRNWRWQINEFFRRPVIKNIGHLVTYISGDIRLARQWYKARGQHHECIMYLSNVYHEHPVRNEPHDSVNIQIGNSATSSNNHLEIFERLLPFRDQNITLFVPLSYGDQEYAKVVIKAGAEMFGEKFHPMIDFMPFDQYLTFLGKIDIAIFNHKRQQAMGNTITLLGLGKKVYLRSDVTPWAMLESNGVVAYNVADISLTPIDVATRENNKLAIKKNFSEKKLIDQLESIFNY